MTFESRDIIVKMLKNNGVYPGDPPASSIYSYIGANGNRLFAVFMDERFNDIYESPYVSDPVLLWSRRGGLTAEGWKAITDK